MWSKDLPGIYHAYDIAASLGYNNYDKDPRRQLRHHQNEFLVSPSIWADDYRVLAIFNASSTEQAVDFHIPGFHSSTIIQCNFARSISTVGNAPTNLSHASYELQKEIYSLTGVYNDIRLYALVLAICGTSYQWESWDRELVITIYCFSYTAKWSFQQGRWKEAEELKVRVMETRKRE